MNDVFDPPVPPFQPPTQVVLRRATGYIELGELLIDGDRVAAVPAQRLLRRALAEIAGLPEHERTSRSATLLEGEALRALGEWEAALPLLRRAAEGSRGRLEAWMGVGWCCKRLGRIHDAIEALRQALLTFPDQPVLHYNLACYHSVAGDVAAAIDHLGRAIAMDARFRDLTSSEPDFDTIRSDPRFVAVTIVTV
jgi:tetratricopeptide (TPR) repeat protein